LAIAGKTLAARAEEAVAAITEVKKTKKVISLAPIFRKRKQQLPP
jgi:hypothetical protein